MNRLFRTITLILSMGSGVVCSFGASAVMAAAESGMSAAGARTPDAAISTAELDALLAQLQPTWSVSTSASVSAGFNDNVLLSPADPARRAFVRTGMDALVWHLPRRNVDYFGFLNAEYTRFNRKVTDETGTSVDHQFQAFAGVEWRYRRADWLTASGDVQGYTLDQVFDLSNFSRTREVENLNVRGGKIGPTVRWSPWHWLWLEGVATADRQKYRDGYNDARLRESILRAGWKPAPWFELSVEGAQRNRDFDRRHPFDEQFQTFAPQLLAITEREANGQLKLFWGRARHWTTVTRAGGERYSDNASGFLDFHEHHIRQEIDWSAGAWIVHAEGYARHKRYDNQTVGAGIEPPHQVKEEYAAKLRVEHKFSPHWSGFAEYAWERSRSNDQDIAAYRVNEGLLGARWSWEK